MYLVCAYPGRSPLERVGLAAKTDPVDLRGVAHDVVSRDEHRFDGTGLSVEKEVHEGDAAHTILDVAEEHKRRPDRDRRGRRAGSPAGDHGQRRVASSPTTRRRAC